MNNIYMCFPGGHHKALTLSYDDGRVEDRRLIEIMNRYGIRGTFHLNGGLFERGDRILPEEIPTLYQGHEVSCHTLHHPTIARCPIHEVIHEVLEDRKVLEKWTGYPVRGLSYPNGSLSEEIVRILPSCGIRYARMVGSSDTFALPDQPLRWQATCHHNHRLMEHAEAFNALFKKQYLYLFYVWGHSYEFEQQNNWDLIETFCRTMGGRDDVWYCTNIELVDCMERFRLLQFSADSSFVYNPSAVSCWIRVNEREPVEIPGGARVEL